MPIYRIDGRLVLFAHIPKTGGTTLDRWLSAAGPVMLGRAHQPRWLPCPPQHLHAEALARLVPPAAVDLAFAVVRHPEDRMVSEFFHRHAKRGTTRRLGLWLRRRPLAALSDARLAGYFDAWLVRGLSRSARDPWWDQNHLRPQVEFTDWPGMQVFRLEDGLDRAAAAIAAATGLPAPALPRDNAAPRRAFALSARARALIRDRYAADFARWYPDAAGGVAR